MNGSSVIFFVTALQQLVFPAVLRISILISLAVYGFAKNISCAVVLVCNLAEIGSVFSYESIQSVVDVLGSFYSVFGNGRYIACFVVGILSVILVAVFVVYIILIFAVDVNN